jgi:hypothetical protein
MFDWRFNNNNSVNDTLNSAQLTSNNNWLTTATAKLGYAWDRTLVYAKGGRRPHKSAVRRSYQTMV